jgi:hypothetical protein
MIFLSAFKYRRGTSSPDGKVLKLDSSKEADVMGTQSANTVFAGPTSGGAAVPAFRALVAADIPAGVSSEGILALTHKTANYAAGSSDCIIIVDTSGAGATIDITLPVSSVSNGKFYTVYQKSSTQSVRIKDGNGNTLLTMSRDKESTTWAFRLADTSYYQIGYNGN